MLNGSLLLQFGASRVISSAEMLRIRAFRGGCRGRVAAKIIAVHLLTCTYLLVFTACVQERECYVLVHNAFGTDAIL